MNGRGEENRGFEFVVVEEEELDSSRKGTCCASFPVTTCETKGSRQKLKPRIFFFFGLKTYKKKKRSKATIIDRKFKH